MKRIIIRIGVLLLVFLGSAALFSQIMNDETKIRTEDMSQATLPLVYMVYKDVEMNPLHGYTRQMEVTEVRDTLTPISTERDMGIRVETFGAKVEDIYFEVLTADGEESLENTKVTQVVQGEDSVQASFTLQNLMRMNQEYVLKIQLKVDGRDVYYYTRVVQQDSLHTKEYLDFVISFSEKCLNKNEVDRLALYMEPEGDVDEVNLSYMDIHTTTDQLVWGELNPQIYYKSIPAIKEINETTATIVQEYLISAQNEEGNVELYTVNEYFRLRYADETVMLLDFERYTNEIFDPDNGVLTDKGINFGICDRDVSYVTDSRNNYFAFVLGGELWSYDASSGKLAQVFTFRQKGNTDYRDIYGQHEIKVLNLSTNGSIYFVVAGYMNRGRHEGESGVAVYYYDASSGGIEEKLFVDMVRSYDLMKSDVQEVSYITDDQEDFYLLVDGDVYEINLTTFAASKLVENMKPGCYAGSESGRHFCWLAENEAYNSHTINIYDLDTKEVTSIACGENERIRMIGYMGEALVYGVADVSDIDAEHEGDELFPMKSVIIVNEQGERVKEYSETGLYVTEASIEDKLLTMKRMRKSGGNWEEASDDHIIDNSGDSSSVGITTQVTDRKQTEMILLAGSNYEQRTPQVVRSRMIVHEDERRVSIEAKEHNEELYYVYAKGKLDSIFENANTAIVRANEQFGVVVDQNQRYIWERGNKANIAELTMEQIPQCILSGTMDIDYLQEQLPDKWVLDLTGCDMDSVLYFISEGNAVLADTVDGVRILMGYDQWGNVRFYQPGAEESYLLSDVDSLELFEKSGNVFIGFLDKPKE
ncbi:MAG: hypothetical protein Q4C50_04105 [Eubacteriales bacterium]|nr:hypothetical protein [Eubacteriales bacterium]